MKGERVLGDCEIDETVTLITGVEAKVIRKNQNYPWWIIVLETESGSECEYHESCRLKSETE